MAIFSILIKFGSHNVASKKKNIQINFINRKKNVLKTLRDIFFPAEKKKINLGFLSHQVSIQTGWMTENDYS